MATFLIASIPITAHTTNPMPFAARLVERGHTVLWYAGRTFHDRIATTGAVPVPYADAEDFGGVDIFEAFPHLAGREGPRLIGAAFADIFVGHAPGRVSDLRRILAEHHVDAMLCDGLMAGVGLVSELEDVPWATFADGPLPVEDADTPPFGPALQPMPGPVGRARNAGVRTVARRVIFRRAQQVYAAERARLGLPRSGFVLDEMTSPYLHLQGCTPSFEYPRREVPAHVHWVGALRPDPVAGWVAPAWWPEVTSGRRPVVHVTQGSLRPDLAELVVPAVRGLAGSDALVVVTTGGADADAVSRVFGAPLPENVRVTPFAPYDELMRHADVVVTNGGYTGVTLALAHGVPLVQAGRTEEKAEIAARIAWSGVGIRLGKDHPAPEAVRDAVERVRTDPSFAAAAGRVRDEMAEHDAGREGAELLERLAVTRAPVPRFPSPALSPRGR